MARRLPRKDVVIVGLGWTGSILAYELARTGLEVVAIERGPWRDTAADFNIGTAPDELRYAVRHDVFLRPRQETLTMRNNPSQTALPIRKWGSFLPGNGVGGAGVHWNGQTWRFLPDDFRIRSHMIERYGAGIMPEGNHIQDWPVSYDELEPHYDKFERVLGISGKAGNIKGAIQPGGNPFEGARERDYPTPPMKQGYPQELFTKAAAGLGLHPFPRPSANLSVGYTNPYGCTMAPCTYCGFCERFGCANYSKSSPQTCVLPALVREPTFEARTECEVTKVNLSGDGKMATGVTYVDASGEEWEQPADLVLVCAYSLFNVRLLLLSGIGKPYDPGKRPGRGRAQLRLPDRLGLDRVLRGRQVQPVRRRRLARCRARRLQQRQFRPRSARLRRRRVDHQRPHQRPSDSLSSDAARHAQLGQRLEEGGA